MLPVNKSGPLMPSSDTLLKQAHWCERMNVLAGLFVTHICIQEDTEPLLCLCTVMWLIFHIRHSVRVNCIKIFIPDPTFLVTVERHVSLCLPWHSNTKSFSLTVVNYCNKHRKDSTVDKHRKDSTVDSHDIHNESTNTQSASARLRGSDQLPLRVSLLMQLMSWRRRIVLWSKVEVVRRGDPAQAKFFLRKLMSPLVEESWEWTSAASLSSGSIFLASCLPSSTLDSAEGEGEQTQTEERGQVQWGGCLKSIWGVYSETHK